MKKRMLLFLTMAWFVTAVMGTGVLAVYDLTPGTKASIPRDWPAQDRIYRAFGEPTLVMFAHPECPCTRASLGELEVLMAHCQNLVAAHVVLLQEAGKNWLDSDLWRSAQAIPGVVVQVDPDGNTAQEFGVTTSGQVVLYGTDGKLLFSGGITEARGHCGDNAGLSALIQILHHETPATRETPVFGCSLGSSRLATAGGAAWNR
jgi:hypothetical protein